MVVSGRIEDGTERGWKEDEDERESFGEREDDRREAEEGAARVETKREARDKGREMGRKDTILKVFFCLEGASIGVNDGWREG